MNVDTAFPSRYLKAADLGTSRPVLTISEVLMEDIGKGASKDRKPVVYFQGKDKGMVLNKTNAAMIKKITGTPDTDEWTGRQICLAAVEVEFQGDVVMAIRVREPKGTTAAAAAEAGAVAPRHHAGRVPTSPSRTTPMRHLILDLETCAIDGADQFIDPPDAPSNYKNPDAIANYQKEAKAKLIDRASLDLDLARVACLGISIPSTQTTLVKSFKNADEEVAGLAWLFTELAADRNTVIVTFNGRTFDLPLLQRRAWYLGLPPFKPNLDRYRSPHLDLYEALTLQGARESAQLELVYQAVRLDRPRGHD